MTKLTEHDACGHPAYNSGVHHAARRAYENKGACFTVYYDGEAIYVRASEAVPPPNAIKVCIAQYFSEGERKDQFGRVIGKVHTVQLRFNGARSEWIDF